MSRKLAPALESCASVSRAVPRRLVYLELRLDLTSIFRASHCLCLKASSDHGLLLRKHLGWDTTMTTSKAMPIKGSCGLEWMFLLFPEFHGDIVLAGPSDLIYQVTHSGPFPRAPCFSLHVSRCRFSYPGSWDTSPLPDLGLTGSFSIGSEWTPRATPS